MSEHSFGSPPTDRSTNDAIVIEAQHEPRRRAIDRVAADTVALTRFEQEQLAREYAEIERASAALRRGQPALRSWSKPGPAPTAGKKPRSLWLLICLLWLSTAVITAGAVAAIATLAG
jgi:hypothetical protein